jgi:hypothetical protein
LAEDSWWSRYLIFGYISAFFARGHCYKNPKVPFLQNLDLSSFVQKDLSADGLPACRGTGGHLEDSTDIKAGSKMESGNCHPKKIRLKTHQEVALKMFIMDLIQIRGRRMCVAQPYL